MSVYLKPLLADKGNFFGRRRADLPDLTAGFTTEKTDENGFKYPSEAINSIKICLDSFSFGRENEAQNVTWRSKSLFSDTPTRLKTYDRFK